MGNVNVFLDEVMQRVYIYISKEAILLCENLDVYICLRLDTTAVHNSR
jgi:hypothetical protein